MRYPRRASKLKLITEISITPLMDLVFILLFAFMVAMPLVTQYDFSRQSDTAATKQATSAPNPDETFTLTITEDGTYRWAGKSITFESLPTLIEQELKGQPQLGVIIQMAPTRNAQDLVNLMNLLDKIGVTRTAIQLITDPAASPAGQ